jgi:hypothetical protein
MGSEADQAALAALIPTDVFDQCDPFKLTGDAIASYSCDAPNISFIQYDLYADDSSMNADYESVREAAGIERDTGDCEAGESAEGYWYYDDPDEVEGRYLCERYEGAAWITYTVDDVLVFVQMRGVNDYISQLWLEFRTGELDPIQP